jgi:hypothetical protein
VMPLHLRFEASYFLRACNGLGCTDSAPTSVMGSLAEAVGYFKASNSGSTDAFGTSVALSDDGTTLVVGASGERSSATGIDGDQTDDSLPIAGAAYVFVRDVTGEWSQQAYVKASNPGQADRFGQSVALSSDGNTLAIGAFLEDSNATGIDGDQANDAFPNSGAVYVFVRDAAGQWSQQAYVKASNADAFDHFGDVIALSDSGDTLAVGAYQESSNAVGIDGNQADSSSFNAGAAYVFVRDAADQWSQQAYIKASNTGQQDYFGINVALSGDGDTLAVGATGESSSATGIDGDQGGGAGSSGAVYVFVRDAADQWSQQAYVKASNTDPTDYFGHGIALSDDGDTLVVGAPGESSNATGIGGDQDDDSLSDSGAVYVLVRDGAGQWSHETYIKATHPDSNDYFGMAVALSDDGTVIAVGANGEDGNATGIGGDEANDSLSAAGAVYVLVREMGQWSHQAYVKASNPGASDEHGLGLALSVDGQTLAVGAFAEDGGASGISGNQADDSAPNAGAVYVY